MRASGIKAAVGGTLDVARILATTEGQIAILAGGYITSLDIPDTHKAGAVLALAVFVILGRTIEKAINGPSQRAFVSRPSQPEPEPEETSPMAPLARQQYEAPDVPDGGYAPMPQPERAPKPRSLLALAAVGFLAAACASPLVERPGYQQAVTCDAVAPLHACLTGAVAAGQLDDRLDEVAALNRRYRAACVDGEPIAGQAAILLDDISLVLSETDQ